MKLKWLLLALLQSEIMVLTSPSIAGVTYMDDFDFEQRYRDVNECNPFHWHPLHMPEICADMYEKLIRSKIGSRKAVRIMRERDREEREEDEYAYSHDHKVHGQGLYGYGSRGSSSYQGEERDFPFPIYEIGSSEHEPTTYGRAAPLTPYEEVLEQLKKDIKRDPSHPKIGVLPNLGPVAMYNQEISKKSEQMIKDLATSYVKYYQESYADVLGYNSKPDPQLYIWDSHKNKTKTKNKHNKRNKHKKGDRITKTRTKHGGIVTIVETLSPRRKRSALYLFGL